MATEKLTANQKSVLQEHEPILQACTDPLEAHKSITAIQRVFLEQRSHHRLLKPKLHYYEILLNSGRTDEAAQGFEAIHKRTKEGTRIHLECTALLGICRLRQKRLPEAKNNIRLVIENTQNIRSDSRRSQFYQRLVKRVEEECILSQLIGQQQGALVLNEIHAKSIELVKKSESELLEQIAAALPVGTPALVQDVTGYSIGLLPPADQKRLPAPPPQIPQTEWGKKALAALKRLGWKSFCDKNSGIYKFWSKGSSKIFGEGYFTSAIITTFNDWKIGLPQLAAGIAATAMRFGCLEFCAQFRPEGLMIPKSDKN